nr:D-Ala-D-Ala carboxypeptidase family metallohydrolase [cf. Phormidesmis sp. LEGE 11477]
MVEIKAGQSFELDDSRPYEGNAASINDDHEFVQLAQPLPNQPGIRWFVYGLHSQIEGTDPGNDPHDEPIANQDAAIAQAKADKAYGPKISLPGISRPVGVFEPVYFEPTVCNFTWSEMTKGGTRIPVDASITARIVELCKYLDEVRAFLGGMPMYITSAYRDPVTNRRVRGARSSRHMAGDAVDFWVKGMNVVDVFYKLKNFHRKGGLAVGNGFVHLDMRPGAPARWMYPGGPVVDLW